MTDEQMRALVKECGLDWQRGYMPLFDGGPTNRYAALIAAAVAEERERCAKLCEERALGNLRLGTLAHPVAHEMLEARDAEAQCCAKAIRAQET